MKDHLDQRRLRVVGHARFIARIHVISASAGSLVTVKRSRGRALSPLSCGCSLARHARHGLTSYPPLSRGLVSLGMSGLACAQSMRSTSVDASRRGSSGTRESRAGNRPAQGWLRRPKGHRQAKARRSLRGEGGEDRTRSSSLNPIGGSRMKEDEEGQGRTR